MTQESKFRQVLVNFAHLRLEGKCQQTSYIKRIKSFLLRHIINILITEIGRSVWEKLDLGRVKCVRSVLTTSVKILLYRLPARLIRVK